MEQKAGAKQEQVKTNADTSYLPECWSDDRRMGVLLAEFRPRQLNAESYDTKMKFWKDLIVSYCIASGSSVVSIAMLKEQFRRKGTVPYCLQTVFQDMQAKKELMKESQHKAQRHAGSFWSNLWTGKQSIKDPLTWGYDAVVDSINILSNGNENENFVVTAVAEQHANTIEKVIAEREICNKLLKQEDLIALLNESFTITRQGADPALTLLEKSGKLTKKTINIGSTSCTVLFKFGGSGEVTPPITDIEISIYELEQSENRLIKDINTIEQTIGKTMDEVREYIKNGRKQMAKTWLKKKHTLEKHMQGKINALETLQCLLLKIHNCQSDKNVIAAYKLGTNALKNAYETAGITIDQIDETMDEMRHVLGQHNEVLSMIGTVSEDDVDELELEQELGDLIDIKLAESKIDTKDFTAVPGTSPIENNTNNVHDFDREIEKRLAALRVDVIEGCRPADHAQ